MQIPPERLAENVLRRVVEEYVSRDGTDWSDMDDRIRQVLGLLKTGGAELHFDEESQTTNIVMKDRR
jgi:uncharacterized protein